MFDMLLRKKALKENKVKTMSVWYKIYQNDCLEWLREVSNTEIHLTFVDPPFNQGKEYKYFNDAQPQEHYWNWLKEILSQIYRITVRGGAIYFMQREKNTEQVLRILRETGWTFQNLIIWKKKTSAVPCNFRFSKQYQIIAFATKGEKPRVFNKLRIDLPIPPEYKYERVNGVYLSDVWDDIRELTSGYFAGDEPIRDIKGKRVHLQQSPVALLLRIILASTLPGDIVLDPFAGTGTTLVVARQIERNSIGIEIDPEYIKIIEERLKYIRPADSVLQYYKYYRHTPQLQKIWPVENPIIAEQWRLF
jgi:site-specific DNA-methyltransferase (adenine-specific)